MNIEEEIKSTVVLNRNRKTVINLLFTGNWINEKSSEFFKQFDLSPQQYNVLRILRGMKGEPANLMHIQERMISKMSNTTRLIDKLKSKDYLTRVQCEKNRRKVEILISNNGLQLLSDIDQKIAKHEESVVSNLTEVELDTLNILLDKLRE
jgi:DNA-binding MarR family transcriptional regulator